MILSLDTTQVDNIWICVERKGGEQKTAVLKRTFNCQT